MRYRTSAIRMGLVSAALAFFFTMSAVVPAEAKQFNLKSQLRQSGISMKIVRLDRMDGFMFGLSFTGPQGNNFVIAPGFNRMFLVQAGGSEVIMQRDPVTGQMQIIQADGDFEFVLCISQAVLTFLTNLTLCEAEPRCVLITVVELVTNILACNSLVAPEY